MPVAAAVVVDAAPRNQRLQRRPSARRQCRLRCQIPLRLPGRFQRRAALGRAIPFRGQSFRSAVALVPAIGQRAGSEGRCRPRLSTKASGSLDTEWRREMLDEICEMSPFYERIIVVSNMESFHDPALFPARYELRKDGMRTVVTASP